MNATLISMGVAIVMTVGLIVTVVGLNFVIGGLEFLLGRPRFEILKTRKGRNGFAFGLRWNEDKEPATFDMVRVRLYNPFGKEKMIEVTRDFNSQSMSFGKDLDLGNAFANLLDLMDNDECSVMVEIQSSKDGISWQYDMRGKKFLSSLKNAKLTADEFSEVHKLVKPKIYYQSVKRSFIADPLPVDGINKLKIATNPEFAGDFTGDSGSAGGSGAENFSVKKVWIDPGCIVCDACETIYPEVFEVTDSTCVIRPDAPLTDGLRIQEAAEACPVEVIKYDK